MNKMKVRELMRPLEEFPHISSQATFMEAVEALEKADQEYKSGKVPQRILLVCDETGKIVGKMSPMDVVQGLEPKYLDIDIPESSSVSRLIQRAHESAKEELRLWQAPLGELCNKACLVKIHEFIKMPTPDHMVRIDDTMDKAFHLFVVERHDSLFVQDGQDIAGLIRFSDVYKKIREVMKACPLLT
ncbi:MAG: CBS domain-containing protein [Desulforhopalus sp.]|nr:CBS domain-containing protein [Desulforhopalus sp.]